MGSGGMKRFEKHVLVALGMGVLLSAAGFIALAVLLMVRFECCRP